MQFNVSFDVASSPDLGSLTAAEQQAVLDTAMAAATIWSWYLTAANVTLDLAITLDNSLFSGSALAQGGPANFIRTNADFLGKHVYESNTAAKLRTGIDRNSSAADLEVGLTVNSIRNLMVFKTDDYAAVTGGWADALSVFLHEIGHGLGFLYLGSDSFSGIGIFDTFVQSGMFTGTNAEQVSGLLNGIPLEPGNESHLAESGTTKSDLMSPALSNGINIHISALDLAILQDIGVPLRKASSGADVMHAVSGVTLRLGAGNDTGYALGGGSTVYGEDGDDGLFGGKVNDILYGGSGDDYFEGAGGNDTLDGGSGGDTAHYSGPASSYQIAQLSATGFQIKDIRSGTPDGTDLLTDIEKVQWSDGSLLTLFGAAAAVAAEITLWRNDDGNVTIWQWDANGAVGSKTSLGVLDRSEWSLVSIGDYNGDGRSDVLLRNANGNWVDWLMNGAAVTSSNTLANLDASWQVRGSGDFDQDGRSDILWQKQDGTVVISQIGADGKIAASPILGTVDPAAWSLISVGDFNGDGKADVLLRGGDGTVAEWLMNGVAIAGSNNLGVLDFSWSLRGTGDFNGDGKADLLWQKNDGTLSMWLMGTNGTLASTADLGTLDRNSWEVREVADYNRDGKVDVLIRNKVDGTVYDWLMSGSTIQLSNNLGTMPAAFVLTGNNRTAASDFGGNGISDVLWQKSDGTVIIWEFDSAGGLSSSTNLGAIPASWSLSGVADYNGDSRTDVLLRNTNGTVANWIMGGAGILTSNTLGNLDSCWSLKGSGDFGGDRNADILWQKSDGTVVIWQFSGAGTLASSTNLGVVNPAAWSLAAVADFNGDGNADVLLRNANGTVADWLMNSAAIAGSNSLGTMDSTWAVKGTGDFNGDGIADIAWQKIDGTVALWQMNRTGGLAVTSPLGILASDTVIGVGDYNGDGKADILSRSIAGSVTGWLSPVSGLSTNIAFGSMPTTWAAITS